MILKKWMPVLGEDHAQTNNLERDDDSKRNHLALKDGVSISERWCPRATANHSAVLASAPPLPHICQAMIVERR
jgi:hypothetical protein